MRFDNRTKPHHVNRPALIFHSPSSLESRIDVSDPLELIDSSLAAIRSCSPPSPDLDNFSKVWLATSGYYKSTVLELYVVNISDVSDFLFMLDP